MPAVKTFGERIADALLEDGLLSSQQFEELQQQQKAGGVRLLKLLIEKSYVSEFDLSVSMGRVLSVPPVNLSKIAIPLEVADLLPDPIPGMEITRMALEPGGKLPGVPHRPGTREYLYCEKGRVVLVVAGERFELEAGDVCTFRGDQPHSYTNPSETKPAVAIGVVTLAPD